MARVDVRIEIVRGMAGEAIARHGRPLPLAGSLMALGAVGLGDRDLEGLDAFADRAAVYLSASLVTDARHPLFERLKDRVFLTYPFALSEASARKRKQAGAWFRVKNVEVSDERLQFNTFFAARILGDALMHVAGNFSQDYLIERIEHRVTGNISPSAFPHVSLGPGQRFLSKGCYVVKPSESSQGFSTVSEWLVP